MERIAEDCGGLRERDPVHLLIRAIFLRIPFELHRAEYIGVVRRSGDVVAARAASYPTFEPTA